jgi:hypothetical protein
MKAVAMITPDPKYFVMKKASGGTRMRFVRAAAIGRRAPVWGHQLLYLDIHNNQHRMMKTYRT